MSRTKSNALTLMDWWKIYRESTTYYKSQSMLFHEFYQAVLEIKIDQKVTPLLQSRSKMGSSKEAFRRKDYGAGSYDGEIQTVQSIVRNQVSTKNDCIRLFQLAQFLQPKCTLELGTSLGFSSSALALGHEGQRVYTLEGDSSLVHRARSLHKDLNLNDVKVVEGNINQTLPKLLDLEEVPSLDIAFLDGNHKYQPTLLYFELIKSHLSARSVVVVDDIFWSQEMWRAWCDLKKDFLVKASLVYGQRGYLFIDDRYLEPVHELWIPTYLKPWTIII